jgi:hypothetical protein
MEQIICRKCGAVDEYYTELKANNNVASCLKCGAFIKNIPYEQPKFYVGKYKGKPISEIDDMGYLKWALKEMKMTTNMRTAIEKQISSFEFLSK